MFNYDHTKRITASQALEHPWMQERGQPPYVPSALMTGVQNASLALRTNQPHQTSQAPQQAVQKTTKPKAQRPAQQKFQTIAVTGVADKKKTGPQNEKKAGQLK